MMKKEVSVKLNKYLASVGVEYVKLHNLHWNVVGKDFKPVHEYLEELYNGLAGSLDSVAELLKISGEVPAASLAEFIELSIVEEIPSLERKSSEILEIVVEDFEKLKALAEEIRKEADEVDDYSVVSAMEGELEEYKKSLWFMKSMLK